MYLIPLLFIGRDALLGPWVLFSIFCLLDFSAIFGPNNEYTFLKPDFDVMLPEFSLCDWSKLISLFCCFPKYNLRLRPFSRHNFSGNSIHFKDFNQNQCWSSSPPFLTSSCSTFLFRLSWHHTDLAYLEWNLLSFPPTTHLKKKKVVSLLDEPNYVRGSTISWNLGVIRTLFSSTSTSNVSPVNSSIPHPHIQVCITQSLLFTSVAEAPLLPVSAYSILLFHS